MRLLIMSFALFCDITIGNYRFRQVNEVRIEKGWREIGSKCVIKLPRHVRTPQLETKSIEDVLATGDAVSVKLKYLGLTEHEEFNGYVSKLKPNIPFEIECEDVVYWMKRTPIVKTWKKEDKATLKTVVKYIVDQVNTQHPQAQLTLSNKLPDVNFTNEKGFTMPAGNNAATALEKIRESFGLASYLRGRELFTGLSYQLTYGRVKHSLAWNVIESNLSYRKDDDTRIRIKPIGFRLNNTKIETEQIIGDKDGEQKTVHYYNVSSEAELVKLAKNDLQKYKFEGFEGGIETFLYPFAEPLMICDLQDPIYNGARDGSYIIDSVTTTFGYRGARREIELGIKTSV